MNLVITEPFTGDTEMPSIKSCITRESLFLLMCYGAGYALNMWKFGVGYITYRMLDFSHFLNTQWLADDLLRSLWYLHAQPPLINLGLGIVFKLAPVHYKIVLAAIFIVMGAFSVIYLNKTLKLLNISALPRMLVVLGLCICPTFYMYGTWLGSTHIEFGLFTFALYHLVRFLKLGERRSVAYLFMFLALLGLIRGQWHASLLVVLAVGLVVFTGFRNARWIALYSLIFLVPLCGWYAKNYYVFGFFGPSSWMGTNLSQVVLDGVDKEIVAQWKAEGKISADYSPDFGKRGVLARFPETLPEIAAMPVQLSSADKSKDPGFYADIAARGRNDEFYVHFNLNYYGLLLSARQDMKDSVALIKAYPEQYLDRVLEGVWYSTKLPAFNVISFNMLNTRDSLPSATWAKNSFVVARIFYFFIPVIVTLFAVATYRRRPLIARLCLLMFGFAFMMTIVGGLLNGAEHDRMRWGWEAIYIVYLALLFQGIWSIFASRLSRLRTNQPQEA